MGNHHLYERFSKLIEYLESENIQVFIRESEKVYLGFIKELGFALFSMYQKTNHDKSLEELLRITQNDIEFLHHKIFVRINEGTTKLIKENNII